MNIPIRIAILLVLLIAGYFFRGQHGGTPHISIRIILLIFALVVIWILKISFRLTLKGVGKTALAKQPDAIHLVPAGVGAWKGVLSVHELVEAILGLGFQEAGSYTIKEMPGVKMHFQIQPAELAYSVVYDHPKAGKWINFISKYRDGTSITFTNQGRGAALAPRPGHPIVHANGLDPASLHARFMAERTQDQLLSLNAAQLVGLFESAYAESLAWRKNKGISAEEVLNVHKENTMAKAHAEQMAALAAPAMVSPPVIDLPLYIARNGQQEGPFTKDQVLAEITAGRLTRQDLGWREGLTDWAPLSSLLN